MRTFLICHEGEALNRIVLPRWLASFSTLSGIIVLRETYAQARRRVVREMRRVGPLRFLDVLAFRLYYTIFLAERDRRWEEEMKALLCRRYPDIPVSTPVLECSSPNTKECRDFLRSSIPDLVIARCKVILKEDVFTIPKNGTFVMHPGICPEYRNAHGCFWALANHDRERVGMTLLKVDRGVDSGPSFANYTCDFDEKRESHIVIQQRTVFDNLDAIQRDLLDIYAGHAVPMDLGGRKSAAWGQPWLTKYLHWKRTARTR